MSTSEQLPNRNRGDILDRLQNSNEQWDVIVVGGGITGAGVLREAVRNDLSALLLEQRDYAWGTSSRSSKMVHGGLRYIAQGDIKLTRHSLVERERLVEEAPSLVYRMGYWFAHRKGVFPGRFIFGILLWLYDLLAGIRDRRYAPRNAFLAKIPGYNDDGLTGASRYTDALVDDARLVLRVLDEAREDGAVTLNYMKVVELQREGERVSGVIVEDVETGKRYALRAKTVVNATGAWADRLRAAFTTEKRVRPLRGSHIVVSTERLHVKEAVIFMHGDDNRPLFIYPWESRTVIGTTDIDHRDDLDLEASICQRELDYVLKGVNSQFPKAKLTEQDVIATWSGVRPVVSSGQGLNPSQERRDHSVWDNNGLVTVTGGKLTTFRQIAMDVLALCKPYLGHAGAWAEGRVFRRYSGAPALPALTQELSRENLERLEGRYGYLSARVFRDMPAEDFTAVADTITLWADLRWAACQEQVQHLDDLLLRRTRLGLLMREGGALVRERIDGILRDELGWDEARIDSEWVRYQSIWRTHYSLPLSA